MMFRSIFKLYIWSNFQFFLIVLKKIWKFYEYGNMYYWRNKPVYLY